MIVSRKTAEDAWALLGQYYDTMGKTESVMYPAFDRILEADVANLYRIAARKTHPDAGGALEAFAAVDKAKHVLLAWLARRPEPTSRSTFRNCTICAGKGKVTRHRGFNSWQERCGACHGSGEEGYDADRTNES